MRSKTSTLIRKSPWRERRLCLPEAERTIANSFVQLEKHGQPNGWFVGRCPLDPVLLVSWDEEVIARVHAERFAVTFKEQFGLAFQNRDPFVLVLVVPKAIRTGLARRDDSLDADVRGFRENFNEFVRDRIRQVV